MSERDVHSPDCYRYDFYLDHHLYNGFQYQQCFGCDYFWHEPLKMLGAEIGGIGGRMERFGLFENDPVCQSVYRSPEKPVERDRIPTVKNPVHILFWPIDAIKRDDSKDEGGISFARLWSDEVARTVWLGVKPFLLTSQYFRAHCIDIAEELRRHPGRLLDEFVSFNVSDCFANGFGTDFWAQLVPYLIWALEQQQAWPYFHLPGVQELKWQRVYKTKVA